jgi:hypothetical protein
VAIKPRAETPMFCLTCLAHDIELLEQIRIEATKPDCHDDK